MKPGPEIDRHDEGESSMKQGTMNAGIFLALLGGTLMFIGVWPLMHIFPPFPPTLSPAEVAARYRDNATGFLAGGILVMMASVLVMPFVGVITTFMKKIEGEHSPLTWGFLAISAATWTTVFIVGLTFSLAAFRLDASDETIRTFSDYNFFMLVVPGFLFCGQVAFFGAAILADGRKPPVLPRWLGYLQLWVCVLSLPALIVPLFKTGPFAWNGALGFWLPTFAFGAWMAGTVWAMLDAVKRNVLAAE